MRDEWGEREKKMKMENDPDKSGRHCDYDVAMELCS